MKKRIVFTLLVAIVMTCLLSIGVYGADIIDSGKCGDNLTWTLYEDRELVISGTGEMRNYSYSSVPWDRYTSIIKSIVIEEGVTTIGDCAFNGGFEITNVDIQGSITRIGDLAFSGCELIRNITLPYSLLSIGESAFYDCNALERIVIPQNVTSIGDSAFYMCYGLTEVELGNNITSIGEEAFFLCNKITGIILPSGLTNIEDGTFWGCSNLTNVTLPERINSIGENAFRSCGIESIFIPNSVTNIGESAFCDCKSLTKIYVPNSIDSIDEMTLGFCSSLTDIIFDGTIVEWELIQRKKYWDSNTGNYIIYCKDGNIDKKDTFYEISRGICGDNLKWVINSNGELIINGDGDMWDYSYSDYSFASEVMSPWYEFSNVVKKICIQEGVTSIGKCAFYSNTEI